MTSTEYGIECPHCHARPKGLEREQDLAEVGSPAPITREAVGEHLVQRRLHGQAPQLARSPVALPGLSRQHRVRRRAVRDRRRRPRRPGATPRSRLVHQLLRRWFPPSRHHQDPLEPADRRGCVNERLHTAREVAGQLNVSTGRSDFPPTGIRFLCQHDKWPGTADAIRVRQRRY